MIELGAYWAHYSMWLKKARSDGDSHHGRARPEQLGGGHGRISRAMALMGEFIQATVAKGHWELDRFSEVPRHLTPEHTCMWTFRATKPSFLDGVRDTLGKALVDYLFVSTHSQALHRRITSELAGVGYRVEVSSDFDNDTTSYDGFVFAASPQAKPIFSGFTHRALQDRHEPRGRYGAGGAEDPPEYAMSRRAVVAISA